jgi:Arc/MetJ-type ribon-helix-helix transcriptional regulator
MPRVTVELTEEDVASIEDEVSAGRAGSRAEAVAAFIREAQRFRALEEIGRLAREGIESGEPIPVTPAYWEKKRKAFEARRARPK